MKILPLIYKSNAFDDVIHIYISVFTCTKIIPCRCRYTASIFVTYMQGYVQCVLFNIKKHILFNYMLSKALQIYYSPGNYHTLARSNATLYTK